MSRPHIVTSSELQSLRDLELVTRATVEGLRQGLHRSPFHGYSAEFSQYRHYRPGDDLKYVDWKALARTDRIYTRQFRETTNLSALLVIDVSRSMDYPDGIRDPGSGIRTKFIVARTIAAILGTLVLDQGDAAGVLAMADRAHFLPPRSGHHHLRVLLAELSRLTPSGTSAVDSALRHAATLMKRRGMVIVVSDFYEDQAAITQIRRLRRMGHDVIAIQVLSKEELSLDVGGAAEFIDLETGRKLLVQPSSARESYARDFGAWLANVERDLRRDGIDYLRVIAGEPLEPALRRFLISRRGQRSAFAPALRRDRSAFAPARRRDEVVMSITWVNPAALAGLALIALPIAIHLLVRQQTRSLPYPSLRFLRETALAAFRRRAVQDAGLLVCRVAVIAAAVTALAGPVLQTASRTAGYANRRSQAMIPVGSSASLAGSEDVFRSATFNRTMIADAIGDALRWLDAQPSSAREIVFGGSLRRGSIVETDLAMVPKDVGIRFVPDPAAAAPNQLTASLLTRRNGRLVRIDQLVHVDADSTRVSDTTMMAVPEDRLRVMATAADQQLAEAALRAAVDEGVPWTTADRRLLLVWEGAAAGSAPLPGVDVVRMDAPSPPASAARAIWNAIDRATARPFVDPVLISREELQSWSRPPGPPSADAVPADEGDRRWWWAVGLALLGLEHFLRRERATARSTDAVSAEARVA